MPRTNPVAKAEFCQAFQEKFQGDIAVNNHHELIRAVGINTQHIPYGEQKRVIGSLIYGTGHMDRYHDKEGQRHYRLRKPFVVGE